MHDEAELQTTHGKAPVRAPAPAPAAGPAVARSAEVPAHQAAFELQRLAGNAAVSGLFAQREPATAARDEEAGTRRSPVLDVVGQGGGTPLDATLRREMEGALGADFSNVRLHTDAKASDSARAVNANAYTVGSDVVIRSDRYNPSSQEGRKTIAHELTHVIQQSSGPVAGRDTGTGIRLSDPSDDYEQAAERTAHAVVSAGAAPPAAAGGGPAGGASAAQLEREDVAPGGFVQREGMPEEEELQTEAVQGEFVQREGMPEEEELQTEAVQGEFVQREEAGGEELEEEEQTAQGEFVQREERDDEDEEQAPGGA